jgi:predicted HD phosphohydrolase
VHVAKRYLKSVEPDFFDDDDAKKTTCPEGHEIKAAS